MKTQPTKESESLDIREFGAPTAGKPQVSNRRLFIQLHVFCGCSNPNSLVPALANLESVLYQDFNHPTGVGVVVVAEDPAYLTQVVRKAFAQESFSQLTYRPEMTMVGRTYASGREMELEDWLLKKPRRNLMNPDFPWSVWYPLRRKPSFYLLDRRQSGPILAEHGLLGQSYARKNFAADIRLASFGLDTNDNEFVIGLVGTDLHPLSRLIQDMRSTQHTAEYIESLGPFFVGHVFWQSGSSEI